jgi:hypothetical protein
MMAILTGIFVLFCAGVIVGQSLLFYRSHEAPKKESAPQVMIQPDQEPGKAVGPYSAQAKEGQEILPPEQKPKGLQQ